MKISGVFFAIVILAFLMPFMVVKCGDTKIASVTGMKLATGGNVSLDYMNKLGDSAKALTNMAEALPGAEDASDMEEEKEEKNEKLKPNIWALIALLMAIGGLISSVFLPKKSYLVPLAMAVVGIITLFMIKSGLKSGMDLSDGGPQIADMIKVQAQFGYYLAFLGFIGAGVLAFLSGRNSPYATTAGYSNIIPDKVETAFDKAKDAVTTASAVVMDKVEDVVEKGKDLIEDADLDEKFGNHSDEHKTVLDDPEAPVDPEEPK